MHFRCETQRTAYTAYTAYIAYIESTAELFTLFQQFWNKKAIVRICNVAILLYGLLSKHVTDGLMS